MRDEPKITIGVRTKLSKYSEGKDPETDEPDEVIKNVRELKGKEIAQYMKGNFKPEGEN